MPHEYYLPTSQRPPRRLSVNAPSPYRGGSSNGAGNRQAIIGYTLLFRRQLSAIVLLDEPAPPPFANMAQKALFDILTTDAAELQALQAAGKLTSVGLVKASFGQIEEFNSRGPELNAIINTTPRRIALGMAKNLDDERSQGRVRGPLHGIPMTVKDNIMTGPEFELPTTVGSVALKSAMAKKNAPIVDMVRSVAV
jgi:hypothetical protein